MPIVTHWAGTVWGTNNGTLLMDLSREDGQITGQVLLFEPNFGQTRAAVVGTWGDTDNVEATLSQFTGQTSVPVTLPKTGELIGTLNKNEGIVTGTWKTDLGTKGNFLLAEIKTDIPVLMPSQPPAPASGQAATPPNALITTTATLGTYRLDHAAFKHLVEVVSQGTNVPQPAINAIHSGHEYIHVGLESLLADPNVPAAIDAVIISANEPAINQGSRTVTINLKKDDQNIVFVSGPDAVWVEGKAAQIQQFLRNHEAAKIGFLRRRGPILNSALSLLLLGLLPSVPSLRNRFIVLALVFTLILTLNFTWSRIVNTRIFLRKDMVPVHLRYADWILAPANLLLGAVIAYLIQKFVR